ncbi:hypothetical protein PVAP13_9NG521828 [Panicum virgatum]|uniref:Uncharacterized protein n=1 Tax=Panicum virgatum TaxID=38727 RepID=A0A8T0MVP1_PANVG|nr:hypothetical protein PVAP13_9NG521828 [Panicum virgatum]
MAAAAGPSPHPPPAPSHGGGGGRGLCGGHGGRICKEHGGSAAAGPPSPRPPSCRNVPWRWRRPSSLPRRGTPSSGGGRIRARLGAPSSGGGRIRALRAPCVLAARRSRAHGGAGALTSASLCGIARWDDGSSELRRPGTAPFFSHIHFFVPPLVMLQNIFDLTNTTTME